ncbi:MAG: WYL domain-containing protein [Clostridiales bacterium]|nr:WYL domain-containing protein [Clostridiales bacterium]
MAKSANQKIKILYLMRILLQQTDDEHGLTLAELSEALAAYGVEAERKTLYSDLETLEVFGLDIEKRKDKTVRYHVVSREFELPELKLLVDAVQSSKFITHRKSGELIKKLESLTSRYEAQQLQRQVFVSNRIKTMNESIYYMVDELHDAIGTNSKITFHYFEWTEKKEKRLRHDGALYKVSPWALTWDDENYYLVAYDSEAGIIKHFRVDRMTRLRIVDERRDGAEIFKGFDLALYSKKTFAMYGGREETVCLRCNNNLASVMIDRFGQDTTFLYPDEEHFDAYVKVAISPTFLTWVMNFGENVKIISPASVQQDLLDHIRKVLSQYEG